MIELGYMAKRIVPRPDWVAVPNVLDIYAVANCVSNDFCDYIQHWKHNGYWFFDCPAVIRSLALAEDVDLAELTLVYYQGYETQYESDTNAWTRYSALSNFPTNVRLPATTKFLGYDVVTYSAQTTPECSPLSCNNVAVDVFVNSHCLIDSLDYAIDQVQCGVFNNSEPGPYRILSVHSVEWGDVG